MSEGVWSQGVSPEPDGGERKKEAVQKIVKMYVFRGLGDASDANDAEQCIISITKCPGDY